MLIKFYPNNDTNFTPKLHPNSLRDYKRKSRTLVNKTARPPLKTDQNRSRQIKANQDSLLEKILDLIEYPLVVSALTAEAFLKLA